jgi:SAM-dependent methyltransferase
MNQEIHAFVPDENLYPAVLKMLGDARQGRVLDAPAGQGAFAELLLQRGFADIDCLDINSEDFKLKDRTRFVRHDVVDALPYPDGSFDYIFSLEGLEHFATPWTFVAELCRVLKPGGRMFVSTPNTFSVDARLKYLVSGYFPRFRPLMQDPSRVMGQGPDQAHICPIYFWQLHYFLMRGGVRIERVGTNAFLYKRQWAKRVFDRWLARLIRNNIRKRGFPDHGVTSEDVLFGDCIIVQGVKAG